LRAWDFVVEVDEGGGNARIQLDISLHVVLWMALMVGDDGESDLLAINLS